MVHITPILSYAPDGGIIGGMGAGGGFKDLEEAHFMLEDEFISKVKQWGKDTITDPGQRQTTLDLIACVEDSRLRTFPKAILKDNDHDEVNMIEFVKRPAKLARRFEENGKVNKSPPVGVRPASEQQPSNNIVSFFVEALRGPRLTSAGLSIFKALVI